MKNKILLCYVEDKWILIYAKKSYEDDKIVRYKYLTDNDNLDDAGEIEISKKAVYISSNGQYYGCQFIEYYFENGMIKFLKYPTKFINKVEDIKDYNAVYVAHMVLEYRYWKGEYKDTFTKIMNRNFEIYSKKYLDMLSVIDNNINHLDFFSYDDEAYNDVWVYMKMKKIYENNDVLRYQYSIDTLDDDDHGIVEFPKNLQIKSFKNYISLFSRLQNRHQIKVDKYEKTGTYFDIFNERRSVVVVKYILDHKKDDGTYLTDMTLINKKAYDYYDIVTNALIKFNCEDEENYNENNF